jgi:NADP-dependent aldehyde dehydrogenase
MALHGKNLVGRERSALGPKTFRAWSPAAAAALDPEFHEATPGEADRAAELAERAARDCRRVPPEEAAAFLDRISEEILAAGDELLDRAAAETALGKDRLAGERTRTLNQLRLFAALVREGSWVDARIDRPIPDRKPLPKPDLRRLLVPIGPVVVFCASNFPLAFSVAGGDTASALAAGCPVIVKSHSAHPGTAEIVGEAILRAAAATGMPDGVFSLVHGSGAVVGQRLAAHPAIRAVALTGSLKAGRALFETASRRPVPVPVYAEMGSVNPVVLLPGALRERAEAIAEGLKASATLGCGQFCTKPGLVLGLAGPDFDRFVATFAELMKRVAPASLLHRGISDGFQEGLRALASTPGVREAARFEAEPDAARLQAAACVFVTDAATFLSHPRLREEVFGPAALVVSCGTQEDLLRTVRSVEGSLTATIHGTEADLRESGDLVAALEALAGRLVFNGFPTGVEVCPSMHHGGPYPATLDAHYTSVGTAAILRFARPACWQNFPEASLPPALRNRNERHLWRQVDGKLTQEDL